MKQALARLLFLLCIQGALAQQEDAIRVIDPSLLMPQFRDSLRLNKDEMKFSPTIPDYDKLDGYFSLFSENQMISKLDKPQKKSNIFNASYSKFIMPTVLISYGILAREYNWLQKLDHSTHHEVNEHIVKRIRLDDYTQFAPAVAVYGLGIFGVKAKHNFKDRTFIMATSHLLMSASINTLKRTTKIERPDGSNFHSFPSGHTATAFVGAHILFKEYKETSPWIGIAGYTVASGTGIMRVFNKKHWISDVVTGAGIGILSVEVSYLLLSVFHHILGKKDTETNLVIAPIAGNDNYSVGLAYTF